MKQRMAHPSNHDVHDILIYSEVNRHLKINRNILYGTETFATTGSPRWWHSCNNFVTKWKSSKIQIFLNRYCTIIQRSLINSCNEYLYWFGHQFGKLHNWSVCICGFMARQLQRSLEPINNWGLQIFIHPRVIEGIYLKFATKLYILVNPAQLIHTFPFQKRSLICI